MQAIWPDAFVEENNLNQSVSALRRALGEVRGENRYIVTVPGRGYRFVADVRWSQRDGKDVQTFDPEPGQSAGWRWRPLLVAGALLLAVLVGTSYLLWRPPTMSSAPAIRRIAVLPFKPLAIESGDDALQMGMADTLIGRLSGIADLTVSPLSAVRKYSAPEQDALKAGRELGVDGVLDGALQRSGDRVRVSARLVRVADGAQLWTGRFDQQFADIFALQDSLAERVASELALNLTGSNRERLRERSTHDARA